VATLITDAGDRESLLRSLRLNAIADGREVVGALEHVARALATGSWRWALEALAKVDLPVLQRFADEVFGVSF
jgi:hypothetical protein